MKGTIFVSLLVFTSIIWVIVSCSTDSTNSVPAPGEQQGVSSSTGDSRPSSSSTVASSSSSTTTPQVCSEYEASYCGGLAYGSVPDNSTTMPTTGNCLYIGDFEAIQPNLNSTVAINGVENTCGSEWGEVEGKCPFNTKPATKDGGYYVYVKTGTLNSYQNNGWKGIVAKAKPACGSSSSATNQPSSSSRAVSSSSVAKSSSSVAAAVSSSSRTGNTTCSATRTKTEIAYIPAGTNGVHAKHKLDLTLPTSGNGPFPVVLFLHGGGFTSGSKDEVTSTASNSAPSKGYALASIGYRLSGDTGGTFPGSFNDILTAIRFLKTNADTYCLDPDRIAVTGFSAGAYHAGMVCVLSGYDNHGLDGWNTLYQGVNSKVQACVTYAALTDMAYLADDEAKNPNINYLMANHGATSPEAGFLGINAALNTLPETAPPNASIRWKANPLNYVTTKTPPLMMIHATNDNIVPWQQSERLVNKVNSVVQGRATFDKQTTGGHSGFSGMANQVFQFFDNNLK